MRDPRHNYVYKNLRPLGRAVAIFLGLGLAVATVDLFYDIRLLVLLNAIAGGDRPAVAAFESALDTSDYLAIAYICVLLVSAVVFLVWVYRANSNAHALGFADLKFTPGWAVGWWFVPIANVVQPARVMIELFRIAQAPDPSAGRRHIGIAPVVVWWLLVLFSNGADRYGARKMAAESVEPFRQGLIATIAGDIMFLTAGVLAFWLVQRITAGIETARALATADAAQPAAPDES